VSFLAIQIFIFIPHSECTNTSKLRILFDESHNQYFSYTNGNFVSALNYLNQSGDFIVNLNKNGTLINATILKSYDVLLIPNPGNGTNFTPFEKESILNWTIEGGSLFIMSDFINQLNIQKKGKPSILNDLIHNFSLPIEFTSADIANNDQTQNYEGQPSFIEVSYADFSDNVIGSKINKAVIRTSCINITSESTSYMIASSPSNSYYLFPDNEEIHQPPNWLVEIEIYNSIFILCGTTEIFSDEINSIAAKSWFEVEDNKRLWINLFHSLGLEENINVLPFFISLIVIFLIAALSLSVYNRINVSKTKVPKVSINELVIERSEILKYARESYGKNEFRKATRYYRRVLNISKKLNDQEKIELYTTKLNECLKKS
jgi:hypothetical protein